MSICGYICRGEGRVVTGEGQVLVSDVYKASRSFTPSLPYHKQEETLRGSGAGQRGDVEAVVGGM